jgi:hypothetical protein
MFTIRNGGYMRKTILVIGMIIGMAGAAFAEKSPEEVTKIFIAAIADGNLESAMKVCATDDYASGFNFEGFTEYLRAITIPSSPPGSSDFYRRITRYEQTGNLARQIQYFCYSFSGNAEAKELSQGKTVLADNPEVIGRFVADTDVSKLKGLKVRKFILLRPGNGTKMKQRWDNQARMYGAQECLDAAVLLDLNGRTYRMGIEFLRYKSGWKIFALYSAILNIGVLEGATLMSEEDFDSIEKEMSWILTMPAVKPEENDD